MSDNTHGRLIDSNGNEWITMTDGELHTVYTPSEVGIDFHTVVQSGNDTLLEFDDSVVADIEGNVLSYSDIERHFTALLWEHNTGDESALSDDRTANGSLITEV